MSFLPPCYQPRLPVGARGVLTKRTGSLLVFSGRNLITDCLIAPAPSPLWAECIENTLITASFAELPPLSTLDVNEFRSRIGRAGSFEQLNDILNHLDE